MRMQRKLYDRLKRGVDVVGSSVGIIVLSPVIGAVALAVRVKLGSPVLFKQQRPGQHGQIFTIYKFRSMLSVDEAKGLVTNDERLTSFGRKLRSTSLDELPSLFNVLKGDMSIVGPRPLYVKYLERYSPEQARRHEVKPGITGLAQVNGRNSADWQDRLAMDVEYVDDRSLVMDVKIILKTLTTAIRRDGISAEGFAAGTTFTGQGAESIAEREGASS